MEEPRKKIILEKLEKQSFDELDRLNLTEEEVKWMFEHYHFLNRLDESQEVLQTVEKVIATQMASQKAEVKEGLVLSIEFRQKTQQLFSYLEKFNGFFKNCNKKKLNEISHFLHPVPILSRGEREESEGKVDPSVTDQVNNVDTLDREELISKLAEWSQTDEVIRTRLFEISRQEDHYYFKLKVKIKYLNITQLDGSFEMEEKNRRGEISEIKLSSGKYYLKMDSMQITLYLC